MARVLRDTGSIDVDPLNVIARSQDLCLGARVQGYRPADLDAALYQARSLFEWGGALRIRPIEQFPLYLHAMTDKGRELRWSRFARSARPMVARVLREVERRGPLTSRDLPAGDRVASYRARSSSGLALYYLWLVGRLTIVGRTGPERVYDLTTRAIPTRLRRPVPTALAREQLVWSNLRRTSLANISEVHSALHARYPAGHSPKATREWIAAAEANGSLVPVEIKGRSQNYWTDPAGAKQLRDLERGRLPSGWATVGPTTQEAATFLAPLDVIVAAGRAKRLFDFDYLWEVYVPAARRRWGYYTLPILWGDSLRARADLRYERASQTLSVLGFWEEAHRELTDPSFGRAVGRGLALLAEMVGARRLSAKGIRSRRFRSYVTGAYEDAALG